MVRSRSGVSDLISVNRSWSEVIDLVMVNMCRDHHDNSMRTPCLVEGGYNFRFPIKKEMRILYANEPEMTISHTRGYYLISTLTLRNKRSNGSNHEKYK